MTITISRARCLQMVSLVSLVVVALLGWWGYRYSVTPRPSSIDASIHAPINGIEVAGRVRSTPTTSNGYTRFMLDASGVGDKLVDGQVQISFRGMPDNLRRGDEVKIIGDLRSAHPRRDEFLVTRGVFSTMRPTSIIVGDHTAYKGQSQADAQP